SGYGCDWRFASLRPTRALALHRLSAFITSLHVAPRRYTTMLNPTQNLGFAPWQDVRFGSLADVVVSRIDVRFTPESGHVQCTSPCPLWAISGHQLRQSQCPSDTAASIPANCATMNATTPAGAIPAKVSDSDRANVTAGLAKDVDAVNQYAAVM